MKPFGEGAGHAFESEQTGDADGNEEISVYECEDGCPVKVLDLQSMALGIQPAGNKGRAMQNHQTANEIYGRFEPQNNCPDYYGDSGGASRFYGQFEPDAPFFYCPKVSKSERDHGIPKGTNSHPTVKPQALLRWLIKLVTPKGGTVLDSYFGSGSTGVAALKEGCQFIGIERDPEFYEIAKLRCASASPQPDVFDLMAQETP